LGSAGYTPPVTEETPRLLVSCGEPSGDLYASELVRRLQEQVPGLRVFGLGGDGLAARGASLVAHVKDLAVVGLLEVVGSLPRLRRVLRSLLAEVDRERPDLAVLIDYSGFNLRLARALKRRNVRIVYYVSPQVWAWRRGRIRTIRETVERILVLFPFEPAVYEAAGVPVTFVGHPLVDLVRPAPDRAAFLAAQGLDAARPLVAVLPGSRPREIAYNLPPLAGAIEQLARERPTLQFALALAPGVDGDGLARDLRGLPVRLVRGQTHALLGAADVALVASGTATVEAALLGTPMVVVYRVSWASYLIGRPFVHVPYYAMVNLVAGRRVVTELIQRDFTPERVAAEALGLLDDPERAARMRADLANFRQRLGGGGASGRAAAIVGAMLNSLSPAP
jgi:lipid-A-disaccharide synthase